MTTKRQESAFGALAAASPAPGPVIRAGAAAAGAVAATGTRAVGGWPAQTGTSAVGGWPAQAPLPQTRAFHPAMQTTPLLGAGVGHPFPVAASAGRAPPIAMAQVPPLGHPQHPQTFMVQVVPAPADVLPPPLGSSPLATLQPPQWPIHQNLRNFPETLYRVLSGNHDHIVSWLPHGRGFVIHDKDRFEKEILGVFFGVRDFVYFKRNLTCWSFVEVQDGLGQLAYYNPNFSKGRKDLLRHLTFKPESQFDAATAAAHNFLVAAPHSLFAAVPGSTPSHPTGLQQHIPSSAMHGVVSGASSAAGKSTPGKISCGESMSLAAMRSSSSGKLYGRASTSLHAPPSLLAATPGLHHPQPPGLQQLISSSLSTAHSATGDASRGGSTSLSVAPSLFSAASTLPPPQRAGSQLQTPPTAMLGGAPGASSVADQLTAGNVPPSSTLLAAAPGVPAGPGRYHRPIPSSLVHGVASSATYVAERSGAALGAASVAKRSAARNISRGISLDVPSYASLCTESSIERRESSNAEKSKLQAENHAKALNHAAQARAHSKMAIEHATKAESKTEKARVSIIPSLQADGQARPPKTLPGSLRKKRKVIGNCLPRADAGANGKTPPTTVACANLKPLAIDHPSPASSHDKIPSRLTGFQDQPFKSLSRSLHKKNEPVPVHMGGKGTREDVKNPTIRENPPPTGVGAAPQTFATAHLVQGPGNQLQEGVSLGASSGQIIRPPAMPQKVESGVMSEPCGASLQSASSILSGLSEVEHAKIILKLDEIISRPRLDNSAPQNLRLADQPGSLSLPPSNGCIFKPLQQEHNTATVLQPLQQGHSMASVTLNEGNGVEYAPLGMSRKVKARREEARRAPGLLQHRSVLPENIGGKQPSPDDSASSLTGPSIDTARSIQRQCCNEMASMLTPGSWVIFKSPCDKSQPIWLGRCLSKRDWGNSCIWKNATNEQKNIEGALIQPGAYAINVQWYTQKVRGRSEYHIEGGDKAKPVVQSNKDLILTGFDDSMHQVSGTRTRVPRQRTVRSNRMSDFEYDYTTRSNFLTTEGDWYRKEYGNLWKMDDKVRDEAEDIAKSMG